MQLDPKRRNPAGGRGFEVKTCPSGRRNHAIRANTCPAPRIGSPIDTLLARLEGAQRSGKGYRAQCPACGGKSRKLSVCEADDGTLLVTCFGCHDTPAVLAAVGLSLGDLYPERPRDDTAEGRRAARDAFRQSGWSAALGVLARESLIVLVAASSIPGDVLAAEDCDRLGLAVARIQRAREVLA